MYICLGSPGILRDCHCDRLVSSIPEVQDQYIERDMILPDDERKKLVVGDLLDMALAAL